MAEEKKINAHEIQVSVPQHLRSGVYANTTNINVSKNGEVALNFVYVNPNDVPAGTLVSRVITTSEHAKQLAKLLDEVIHQLELNTEEK